MIMNIDRETFFNEMRRGFGTSLTQEQVDGIEFMLSRIEADETFRWIEEPAYILATAWHETDRRMQPIREYGGPEYIESRYDPVRATTPWRRRRNRRMGNTEEGDGWRYRGRGYVQLTFKANYERAGECCDIDFVAYPDLALNPEYAWGILVHGMRKGWFGQPLGRYINETKHDFIGARRSVNGQDKAAKIAGYAKVFLRALDRAIWG